MKIAIIVVAIIVGLCGLGMVTAVSDMQDKRAAAMAEVVKELR